MKANPGGMIAPADVIGRDKVVLRLWDVLKRQSVLLTAERRMGKTCLIKKMEAESPPDVLSVYRDLEGLRTPLEFAEDVFQTVREYLSKRKKTAIRTQKILGSLGGGGAAGFRFPENLAAHWKVLLTSMFLDLAEHQDSYVVFFWDELPLMLQNIAVGAGEDQATELLDTLRQLRQTHDKLRMVFAGSIGLHNVLSKFKQTGYANAPVNDMLQEDLPPLAPPDAADLAARLLDSEDICDDPLDPTPAAIAEAVDCVPYYIHHVVDQMKRRSIACSPDAVAELVTSCLVEAQDPWELQHYLDRVSTYYDPEDRPTVLALLDALAGQEESLAFDGLFNLLASAIETDDRENARDLLVRLQRDHYVSLDAGGTYRFTYPMIKRWWCIHRGL